MNPITATKLPGKAMAVIQAYMLHGTKHGGDVNAIIVGDETGKRWLHALVVFMGPDLETTFYDQPTMYRDPWAREVIHACGLEELAGIEDEA